MNAPLPVAVQGDHRLSSQDANKLLAGIQIPPQPEIVRALLSERFNEVPDTRRIAGLISKDVGLAAVMLKTINSPLYGLRRQMQSIDQAVSLLGFNNVSTLTLGLSLRTNIKVEGIEHYWESASRTGQIAAMLARHLHLPLVEEAQLYGLFHDSAMPLLLQRFPDYSKTMHDIRQTNWVAITGLEDARHNTNHAIVGGLLASNWGLAEVLRDAITLHHDPLVFISDGIADEVKTLISLGHVAEMVEQTVSENLNDCAWEDFGTHSLSHLSLDVSELQDFMDKVHDRFGPH
jgi:HD-like signal output (HDOD) protein